MRHGKFDFFIKKLKLLVYFAQFLIQMYDNHMKNFSYNTNGEIRGLFCIIQFIL